jgi:hypothetical protein
MLLHIAKITCLAKTQILSSTASDVYDGITGALGAGTTVAALSGAAVIGAGAAAGSIALIAVAVGMGMAENSSDDVVIMHRRKKIWPKGEGETEMEEWDSKNVDLWFEVNDDGIDFNVYDVDAINDDDKIGKLHFGGNDVCSYYREKYITGDEGAIYTVFYRLLPGYDWSLPKDKPKAPLMKVASAIMLGELTAPIGSTVVGTGFEVVDDVAYPVLKLDDGYVIKDPLTRQSLYPLHKNALLDTSYIPAPQGSKVTGMSLTLSKYADGGDSQDVITPALIIEDDNGITTTVKSTVLAKTNVTCPKGWQFLSGIANTKSAANEVGAICVVLVDGIISCAHGHLSSPVTGYSIANQLHPVNNNHLVIYESNANGGERGVLTINEDDELEVHLFNNLSKRYYHYQATTRKSVVARATWQQCLEFKQDNKVVISSGGNDLRWTLKLSLPQADILRFIGSGDPELSKPDSVEASTHRYQTWGRNPLRVHDLGG